MSALLHSEYWLFTESMYRCQMELFCFEIGKKIDIGIAWRQRNFWSATTINPVTKHFNMLNSKETKYFSLEKGRLYTMKALVLCISEFWWPWPLRIWPSLWVKNGKQKTQPLMRICHAAARSLIHGIVKHFIPLLLLAWPHVLSVKMNFTSSTILFPQMVNHEIKDVLLRQCFSM